MNGICRLSIAGLTVFFILFSSIAFAYDPPDQSKTFYGDVTGDANLMAEDITTLSYYLYSASNWIFFDTPQPDNADQAWNTCDISGDGLLLGDDYGVLKQVTYGFTNSFSFSGGWFLSGVDFPAAATVGESYPFQVSVKADNGGTFWGRAGVVVMVTVDAMSPVQDVTIGGRPCVPAQPGVCALGVSITDFIGDSENAPTESDANTLSFTPNSNGEVILRAEILANPKMNIPAELIQLTSTASDETTPPDNVWFVDIDATGANNGTSWTDAFTCIQDAMDVASSGKQVWVAEGAYTNIPASTASVLTMKDGVEIYGGFIGTEINLLVRGDPAWYPTILDGEDSSKHVVIGASYARLDGFTVTGGNTPHEDIGGGGMYNEDVCDLMIINCIFSGNYSDAWGGSGMYNSYSDPTIIDCTFSGNSVNTRGGGMYNGYSSPTITNCIFSGNYSDSESGGMYNSYSDPTITDCTFIDNYAYRYGGGMFNGYSDPILTGCTFTGNEVGYSGGGMYNGYSDPILTDCTFTDNYAYRYGGGVYSNESNPTLTDCTFSGNNANIIGGLFNGESNSIITNCTFTGNYANESGGMRNTYCSPTITNCVFAGNEADKGGGMGNYAADPQITNCTFYGNIAIEGGGMYNCNSSCPQVINCIMWGNTASGSGPEIFNSYSSSTPTVTYSNIAGGYTGAGNINADPEFINAPSDLRLNITSPCVDTGIFLGAPEDDIDGNPRPLNLGFDMGAYEHLSPPACFVSMLCPDSFNETSPISCMLYYSFDGCTGVLSIGAGNTCTGANIIDNGDSTGDYTASAQGETVGPGSCLAEVQIAMDGVSTAESITINEVNQNSYFTSIAPTFATEHVPFSYSPTFDDDDWPDVDTGDPGYFSCVGIFNNTCEWMTPSGCEPTGYPVEIMTDTTCSYDITIQDGYGAQATQTVDLTINKSNRAPYWTNTPNDIEVGFDTTYEEFNGVATDDDLPIADPGDPGYIECGVQNNTCSFGVAVTGDAPYTVDCKIAFTSGSVNENCTVDVVVTDGHSAQISQNITIDVSNTVTWYVDIDATGAGTGTSWTDAYNHPQDAMDLIVAGDQIWVAEGIYYRPVGGTEPVVTMSNGAQLYGGFVGTETDFSERGAPALHPTILDGEDTSYHVIVGASNTRVDGFTITNGNAIGVAPDNYGGGMYNDGAVNVDIENCVFTSSYASRGGSIYNNSSPTQMKNCLLTDNSAVYGGAIYNNESSDIEISNCTFTGNYASANGGAIRNWTSSPVITNCIFWDDYAPNQPEIVNYSSSIPVITYTDFMGGYAGDGNIDSDPLFVSGPEGDLYLSQTAAGQGSDSPCVDAGSDTAANLGMDDKTTRTDNAPDTGVVDMGFHYPIP